MSLSSARFYFEVIMNFEREKPYNDLPLLLNYDSHPYKPDFDFETKTVLKKAKSAGVALGELKWAARLIPNPAVLVNAIVLQESKISSEIENIVTTTDEIYRALSIEDEYINQNTKEVLYYREALQYGWQEISKNQRKLTTSLFEDICKLIKKNNQGIRKVPGIRLGNPNSGEIIYTPPDGEKIIRDKLSDLEKFIYSDDDVDPLVKMAVIHYQFESIHPFTDGNGRTGRIINLLYLYEMGLLEFPILYLSKFIIENKPEYLAGFQAVTEGKDWEKWILFMLNAIEKTALSTTDKIIKIKNCMDLWSQRLKEANHKIYSKDLIEAVFEEPYSKIRTLEVKNIAKREAASKYLKVLSEIGLLTPRKIKKEIIYINLPFLNLLAE
jgi:Fic family protein